MFNISAYAGTKVKAAPNPINANDAMVNHSLGVVMKSAGPTKKYPDPHTSKPNMMNGLGPNLSDRGPTTKAAMMYITAPARKMSPVRATRTLSLWTRNGDNVGVKKPSAANARTLHRAIHNIGKLLSSEHTAREDSLWTGMSLLGRNIYNGTRRSKGQAPMTTNGSKNPPSSYRPLPTAGPIANPIPPDTSSNPITSPMFFGYKAVERAYEEVKNMAVPVPWNSRRMKQKATNVPSSPISLTNR